MTRKGNGPVGRRVIERITEFNLLPAPESSKVVNLPSGAA